MMMHEMEQSLSSLRKELNDHQTALDDLSNVLDKITGDLESCYAFEIRSGAPKDARQSYDLEVERSQIEDTIKRHSAALRACEADIAEVEAELVQVKWTDDIDAMQEAIDRLQVVAGELGSDFGNPALWRELVALTRTTNRLFSAATKSVNEMVPSGENVFGHVWKSHGVAILTSPKPELLDVGVVLDLTRAGNKLDALRRQEGPAVRAK